MGAEIVFGLIMRVFVALVLAFNLVAAAPKPARAFDFELLYMLVNIMAWGFTNNKCEKPIISSGPVTLGNNDISSDTTCDPYYYTHAEADGLKSDTHSWDIALPVAVTDTLTVGLILGVGVNNTTWDQVFSHDFDSDFVQVGGFAAWDATPETRVVGAVVYTNVDTDFTAVFPGTPTSGSFGTDIWGTELRVDRRIEFDGYWFQPSAGIHHFEAETDSFFDTGFNSFTPSIDISATQVKAGGEVGIPVMQGPTGPQMTLLANAAVFYHTINQSGVVFGAGTRQLDHHYFGGSIGGGFAYHVKEDLEFGAKAKAFTGGDADGFQLQAFLNFDFYGLSGRDRPPPLLQR